jgi:hypothetical protein
MNEFFENRLNTAHALIDEEQYDAAVILLKNLDARIHDVSVSTNLNALTGDIEKQYMNSLLMISNKAGDPWENYKQAESLRKWRAQQYLRLYDVTLQKSE